jgi:hypothetical protein
MGRSREVGVKRSPLLFAHFASSTETHRDGVAFS